MRGCSSDGVEGDGKIIVVTCVLSHAEYKAGYFRRNAYSILSILEDCLAALVPLL